MNPSSRQPKLKLVANPVAGNHAVSKNWNDVHQELKNLLGDFSAEFTTRAGDATRITQSALQQGCETIVAIGGDGTINEVVNGFFQDGQPLNAKASLAIIPMGTGGDLIKTLQIPETVEGAAQRIIDKQICKCDVGVVTCRSGGEMNARYFINIADAGFGATVVDNVRQSTKALGPFFAYLTGLLRALTIHKNHPIRITVDDTFEAEGSMTAVVVANGQFFGGGMWIAPRARLDDGQFEVVIIGDITRTEFIANVHKIYNGTLDSHPKVRYMQGRKILLHSDSRVGVEADGEQAGILPATFEILPGKLNVLF